MEPFLIFLIYPAIGVLLLGLAAVLYFRASLSRKSYRCPQCHEVINVELMDATYCNVCGAPLRRTTGDYQEDFEEF